MAQYTDPEQVKIRLRGKVRFSDDATDVNKMDSQLLNRLINEAEGQVEFDLSPRYANPFRSDDGSDAGGPFRLLPARPTQEIIKTLCEIQSVLMVLNTDFGRSGSNDGTKYAEALEKRYEKILKQQLERRTYGGKESGQWKYPPLPGLQLSYFNQDGDTGYTGQVLTTTTTQNHGNFPQSQINSPGESFFNGVIDEDEQDPNVI